MAIDDRPLGPGGVLALIETQRENEELKAENAELRRQVAYYEGQLFPVVEVADG